MKNQNTIAKGKRHPILACVIDIYVVSILGTTIVSLLNTLIQMNLFTAASSLVSVIAGSIVFILPIIYHNSFWQKTLFVSPGEFIVGCRNVEDQKVWQNQYESNRLGIFFIVIVNLVILSNMWDASFNGAIYPLAKVVGYTFRIALVLYALKLLGDRKLAGIIIVSLLTAITALAFLFYVADPGIKMFGIYLNGGLLVIYLAIYLMYSSSVKLDDAEESSD